jgi:XTP/dITP diphosphohydrolase
VTSRPLRLLLASNNRKKLAELRLLLADLGVVIVLPSEIGGVPDVVEDAPTFAGNAAKKAESAARAKQCWALADDSGLCVDALDGANNRLLLERLAGLPAFLRGAHFTCALALARPDGTLAATIEGRAHGRILHAPRGTHDFGYDPLFEFTEPGFAATGRSFAELEPADKGEVSHRGRALRELLRRLPGLMDEA